MKGKIALASALAAFVTVGGVYATWSFAEKDTQSASTSVNVAMTGLTGDTEKGTLSVTVMHTGGFTLAVDDADNNHLPEIMKTGTVIVTFTPAATASEDVKANGIDVQFSISYAPYENGAAKIQDWTYNDTQIFQFGDTSGYEAETNATEIEAIEALTESVPVHLDKEDADKQSNGSFVWTIEPSDIPIYLTKGMADTKIDTLEKYNAMNAELAKGHFVITVSECTTVHNP